MKTTALVFALLLSTAALAQEVPVSSSEFGRASGGEIRAITKDIDGKFSGTLGFTTSSGFLSGRRNGYNGSVGGTLVDDRAWFFASAESLASRYAVNPTTPNLNAFDAKLSAAMGDAHSFDATYSNAPVFSPTMPSLTTPSSFLSLRYTGVISSNMFMTAIVSRTK